MKSLTMNDLQIKIREKILSSLGRPPHYKFTTVSHLWANRYRVNVYVLQPSDCIIPRLFISDSFFVRIKEDGEVLLNETISRKY